MNVYAFIVLGNLNWNSLLDVQRNEAEADHGKEDEGQRQKVLAPQARIANDSRRLPRRETAALFEPEWH
jgi:hypothetical protein